MTGAEPQTREAAFDMLLDSYYRAALADAICVEPLLEDLRTAVVAAWLDAMPNRRRVGFCGCGSLSARLAQSHRASLDRHAVTFFSTSGEGPDDFHGYPRSSLTDVLEQELDSIALMSGTYAQAMREALAGCRATAVLGLDELCRSNTDEATLALALARINAEADALAARLDAAFPPGSPTVVYLELEPSPPYERFFRALKDEGLQVVIISRQYGFPDGRLEAMQARGDVDFIYRGLRFSAFWIMTCRLLTRRRFGLVLTWYLYCHLRYLDYIMKTSLSPVVIWHDLFLQEYCKIQSFISGLERVVHLPAEAIVRMDKEIYAATPAVAYRYQDSVVEEFRAANGLDFAGIRILRPVDRSLLTQGNRLPKLSAQTGRTHIAFINALNIDPLLDSDLGWRKADVWEFLSMLNPLDMSLSVFNAVDWGTGGYEDLEDEARNNPLFDYSPRIDFERLVPEISRRDFGWLYRRVDSPQSLRYCQTHLPFSVVGFLNAGLPIIVSRELEYIASLVQEWGVGIVLAKDQWHLLPQRIATFDHEACARNIAAACEELDEVRQGHKLGSFLLQVMREKRP